MPVRSRRSFLRASAAPLAAVALGAVATHPEPAMAVEEPAYEVVRSAQDIELRRYGSTLVAQTRVEGVAFAEAGSRAFGILAGYIFGKNKGARKIAMTAPVTQSADGSGATVVQFAMPAGWTLDTLPEPLDPRVELREVPARTVAAIRYSGTWSAARYEEHLRKLREALSREGLVARGEPVWARYNGPTTPWFLRRNEVLLEVAAGG
jgi:hypothetical protein